MSVSNIAANSSACSTFKLDIQEETPRIKKALNAIGQFGSLFGNSSISNRDVVVKLNGVQVNYNLLHNLVQLQRKSPTKMQAFLSKHFAELKKGKISEEELRVVLDTHLMFLSLKDKNGDFDSIRLAEGHTYLSKLNEMLKEANPES